MLNPGAATNPTCSIDGIGLSANYETRNGNHLFNFQHILFLLRSPDQTTLNSFRLECSVEICEKNDASSKCNPAAAVCMNTDQEKSDYICDDEACPGVGQTCEVSAENQPSCDSGTNQPSCDSGEFLQAGVCVDKTCVCLHGNGAVGVDCSTDGVVKCDSCKPGYNLQGGFLEKS